MKWCLLVVLMVCSLGCPRLKSPKEKDFSVDLVSPNDQTFDAQEPGTLIFGLHRPATPPDYSFDFNLVITIESGEGPAATDPIVTLEPDLPNAIVDVTDGGSAISIFPDSGSGWTDAQATLTYSPHPASSWKIDFTAKETDQAAQIGTPQKVIATFTPHLAWNGASSGGEPEAILTDYADGSFPVDIDTDAGTADLIPSGAYTNDFASDYMGALSSSAAGNNTGEFVAAGALVADMWLYDVIAGWDSVPITGASQLGVFDWNGTEWIISDNTAGIFELDLNGNQGQVSSTGGTEHLACGTATCCASTNAGFLYSANSGATWSTSGTDEHCTDIDESSGRYFCFDVFNAQAIYSDDCVAWNAGTFPDTTGFDRIACSPARCVGVRGTGVFYSDDGTAWTAGTISPATGLNGIAYSPTAQAWIGYSQGDVYLSADGATFSQATTDAQFGTILRTVSGL